MKDVGAGCCGNCNSHEPDKFGRTNDDYIQIGKLAIALRQSKEMYQLLRAFKIGFKRKHDFELSGRFQDLQDLLMDQIRNIDEQIVDSQTLGKGNLLEITVYGVMEEASQLIDDNRELLPSDFGDYINSFQTPPKEPSDMDTCSAPMGDNQVGSISLKDHMTGGPDNSA
ncbi:hypothetical protein HOF46_02070 [Candidatus Woesearchaeota archaeon]|nr:hypothetical protein [Candidatus Woesearchaeota archaeon]